MTFLDNTNAPTGSAFNARPDLQQLLDETRTYVASRRRLLAWWPGLAALWSGEPAQPRYARICLHPPALAAVCDTAFTDGIHTFFYAPFLESLRQSEQANPGSP